MIHAYKMSDRAGTAVREVINFSTLQHLIAADSLTKALPRWTAGGRFQRWKLSQPLLRALQRLERNASCDVLAYQYQSGKRHNFSLALLPPKANEPGARIWGVFRSQVEFESIKKACIYNKLGTSDIDDENCAMAFNKIRTDQINAQRHQPPAELSRPPQPVWGVYQSALFRSSLKGRGNGYLAYRAMAIFVGKLQGYFVPDRCAGGSTSEEAQRVWHALRKEFASVGPVILPFEHHTQRPDKPGYPKATLVLVGCGRKKCQPRPGAALSMEAQDLYISDFFKKKRKWAETHGHYWAILSAGYGLLRPFDNIEPYDVNLKDLSKEGRKNWTAKVAAQILASQAGVHGHWVKHGLPAPGLGTWGSVGLGHPLVQPGDTVYILAGTLYRNPLSSILEEKGVTVINPLEGMSIGQQKKWLKENA